jgi:polar amino acid transport system substrate-binding protein
MMSTPAGRLVVALALILMPLASALAQTKKPEQTPKQEQTQKQEQAQRQELRVVTRVLPPLVIEQPDGTLSGFSIELWNRIGEKLNLKTKYQAAPDVRSLLADVRAGKADVGVAAISITSARETEFDFSQPILNAGLQIMVRGKGEGDANPLWDLLGLLFSPTILVWLGIALLLILIPAHIVWYLERQQKDGIIPTDKYYPGIFYAMYWAAATLATQAEQAPRHWIARIVTVLWMFTGVVFVAFYTAQLAATLTVQQIQGGINGPDDLPGKKVATTRGSTAAEALRRELRADVHEVARIEEAYKALLDRQVEAVVFDAPVLLFYAAKEGKGRVQMVGTPFRKEDYGIVFPRNAPLRKQVNVALLALREDGTYQQLYDKWFGGK